MTLQTDPHRDRTGFRAERVAPDRPRRSGSDPVRRGLRHCGGARAHRSLAASSGTGRGRPGRGLLADPDRGVRRPAPAPDEHGTVDAHRDHRRRRDRRMGHRAGDHRLRPGRRDPRRPVDEPRAGCPYRPDVLPAADRPDPPRHRPDRPPPGRRRARDIVVIAPRRPDPGRRHRRRRLVRGGSVPDHRGIHARGDRRRRPGVRRVDQPGRRGRGARERVGTESSYGQIMLRSPGPRTPNRRCNGWPIGWPPG